MNKLKLIGVIFLSVLLFTNCKKENKVDNTQSPGEVVFAPFDVINDAEKDGDPTFDVLCNEDYVVHHALILLEDEDGIISEYEPLTFELYFKLYTQSIKLDPGYYIIKQFSLMTEDDEIVKSTPMALSEYAGYVTQAIDGQWGFTIYPFEKEEFEVDVLCYIPAEWDNFGFEWFEVTEITLREQCFFGDICITDYTAMYYEGSLYDNPLVNDEVAIFKIQVFRDRGDNPVMIEEFGNWDYDNGDFYYNDEGDYIPLCVQYADYDLETNEFQFDLLIYSWDGFTLDYHYYHTFTFFDDAMLPSNNWNFVPDYDDGVVDFVLGDCVVTPSDIVLSYYP